MSTRRRGRGPEYVALGIAAIAFLLVSWGQRDVSTQFVLTPREPNVLRIATWNVGHGLDQGGGGLPCDQVDDVVRAIVEMQAQGVALQELKSVAQANRLVRRLVDVSGDPWHARVHRGPGSLVAFLALGEIVLEREQQPGSRSLLLRWTTPTGETVSVAVLHAEAFSAGRRNLEIGAMVERLERLHTSPSVAQVLLGDLNLDLDIGERGDLFTDDRHLDVESYNFATRTLQDIGRRSGPTAQPDRRLDYVLAETRWFVNQVGPWSGASIPGMDHKPLLVDWKLP